MRCKNFTSNNRGGNRYLPFAFTREGIAMLSGLLRSEIAVKANINIMRAFFQMQEALLIVGDALGSFPFASLFQKEDRGSEQRRAQTAVERCGECCWHANDLKSHFQAHHENHNHPSANRKSL